MLTLEVATQMLPFNFRNSIVLLDYAPISQTYHSWIVNVAEASGGEVDFWFHVWAENKANLVASAAVNLAKQSKYTKGFVSEAFSSYFDLLNKELPKTTPDAKNSWLGDVESEFHDRLESRPFR